MSIVVIPPSSATSRATLPHDPQRLRPFLFQEARSPVVTSVVRRRRDRDVAHLGIAREQRPCPERRAAQE
jgi:hypothetical protein